MTHFQLHIQIILTMKLLLLTASVLISSIFAQDTYHCPDGWLLEEDRSGCRCFLLSGSEMVTKDDADILCAYHDGAWVAELDHPGLLNLWPLIINNVAYFPLGINYWLKSQLLDLTEIGEREQFWLGAYTNVKKFPIFQILKIIFYSFRSVTVKITLENGSGPTWTRQLNGLTGLMVNLTTSRDRIVLWWESTTIHCSLLPEITSGMTLIVIILHIIFVKTNVDNK